MLQGIFGNATEIDIAKLQADMANVLIDGEKIERGFKIIRDLFIFTDKRLILVDKQGFTGSKVEYHSIPYKSITHFAVETAGRFDMDAEMKIWLSGKAEPIQKDFKKGTDVIGIQKTLAKYILKQG